MSSMSRGTAASRRPAAGSGIAAHIAAVLGSGLWLAAAPVHSADVGSDEQNGQTEAESNKSVDVTVLGHRIKETSIPMEATSAVSTLKSEEIERLIPTSPLDLLSNVPGVYVDSSQGVVSMSSPVSATFWTPKGNYFSRGLAFIQIEEDGLPIEGATVFGVEQLLRSDLTLGQLEVLRGGSAAVVAANAPGGLFNYVSKTGGDELKINVRGRLGLQGDGHLPYYRTDLNIGGPLARPDWYFNIGGYYQRDHGARDAGFVQDRGGQIKGNLVRKFDHGSIMLYGKYMDDHNAYSQAVPMRNWSDPRPVQGWSTTSSVSYHPEPFSLRIGPNEFIQYDFAGNMVGTTSTAFGVKSDFELGSGWSVHENLRYSTNNGRWDGPGQGSMPNAITDNVIPGFTNFFGIPGITTYTDLRTGRSAQVESVDGTSYTLLNYDLPHTPGSVQNAVMFQGGNIQVLHNKEYIGKLSLEKKTDKMLWAFGTYLNYADFSYHVWGPFGASTFEPRPHLLDIKHELPDGTVLQITNPQGMSEGILRNTNDAIWKQASFFVSNNWQLAPDWTFDAGVRYEYVDVRTANALFFTRQFVSTNPATRYDNSYFVPSSPPQIVDRNTGNTSWTAALSHDFTEQQSLYLRYARGKKSPDYGFYQNIWDEATDRLTPTVPQKVTQIELGYRFQNARFRMDITPYYSLLSAPASAILLRPDPDGSPFPEQYAAYTPANETDNYGVEFDGEFNFGQGFALRAALTVQKSKILKNYQFEQPNGPGPVEDAVLVQVNKGNDGELIPDMMATITPSYTRGPFRAQLQWQYIGDRPANNYNAWDLPGFDQSNLDLAWNASDALQVNLTVNNLFASRGIMQWGPPGGFNSFVGRGIFTKVDVEANPDAVFAGLAIPARAYFLSVTYRL
jgi:outer membrane receptor protein involved in Fe transport